MLVRLPRTATRRKALSHAQLLERFEPNASDPFDFYGKLVTPGATIEEHELWPTEHYPAVPIIHETCQLCFSGRGHHRNPYEHILWSYRRKERAFRQVARVSTHHYEDWIRAFLPVLRRLMQPPQRELSPDLHTAARRIAAVIEGELLGVYDNDQRSSLLQTAYEYMSARRADIGRTKKLYQLPLPEYEEFFRELALPVHPEIVGLSAEELDTPDGRYGASRFL